jgi:hypothetical protein
LLFTAALAPGGCGSRPTTAPEQGPAPASSSRERERETGSERERAPEAVDAAESSDEIPSATAVPGTTALHFDAQACREHRYVQALGLGSQRVDVRGPEGEGCVFEVTSELEGGYRIDRCRIARSAGEVVFPKPNHGPVMPPGACKRIKKGNLFLDADPAAGAILSAVKVSGTDYVVYFMDLGKGDGPPVGKDSVGATITIWEWPADVPAGDSMERYEPSRAQVVDRPIGLEIGKASLGPAIDSAFAAHPMQRGGVRRLFIRREVAGALARVHPIAAKANVVVDISLPR